MAGKRRNGCDFWHAGNRGRSYTWFQPHSNDRWNGNIQPVSREPRPGGTDFPVYS
jgi:hypothetical protein